MKISNSFVIKLVVVTIFFKIISECSASEHCIPVSYEADTANIVTGSGFTPEEAEKNFYLQLPKIGIKQTVNVTNNKFSKNNYFSESTFIHKAIKANFDYITKFQCKKKMRYLVSAIFPKRNITYLPEFYTVNDKQKKFLTSFFTFKNRNKICGEQSFHVITSTHLLRLRQPPYRFSPASRGVPRIENTKIAFQKQIGNMRINVICGFNWQLVLHRYHTFTPKMHENTWTKITYNRGLKDHTSYLQLQMISNAIKGE